MEKETIKMTKLASCAGCGAKVGAGVLAQLLEGIKVHSDPNLLVGFDKSDDASVYKISDDLALVQTVDFFPPIADDPYTFGQIAAVNALSDVYAMGGEPKLALNIMCIPEDMPKEAVHQMLRGGYDKVYEAGALITGGHSILDPEPKYGLCVTGFVHPDHILTNSGARPGDVLLLTKPIGIGVLTTAQKAELLSETGEKLALSL
ncbi:MAG: selenide, water dikinase SelD, partial [Oscillospiraceae bacterium]